MERLSRPAVTDDDILDVLREWRFKTQQAPEGTTHVHSNTLGATRGRDGKLTLNTATKRHPAVFALLSRWLESNLPSKFQMPFHFTSIQITCGYS